MIYNLWKLIHLLAAIIFIGNITFNFYWKIQAEKSHDRLKIAEAFKIIMQGGKLFIMPSVAILFIFGIGAAMQSDLSLIETSWILWGIILLIISAYAIMAKVIPIQKKIYSLALNEEKFNFYEYLSLSKKWNFWQAVAVATPYIAVILMVLKP
ncbi:MAG: DUF2269 family protein [Ignavibacteriaceae bacterium]